MQSIRVALAAITLSALNNIAASQQIVDRKIVLDIASQPIEDAINELARQSGIQIAVLSKVSGSIIAPRIAATLTPREALTNLLADTPLLARWLDSHTVAVYPTSSGQQSAKYQKLSSSASTNAEVGYGSVRLAQTESPSSSYVSSSQTSKQENGELKPRPNERGIEEITITGSHIRGAAVASPVIELTREDIEASGNSTLGGAFQTLTQSFGGGVNPGQSGVRGTLNGANYAATSTANLRGLGPNATLTLINGHRFSSADLGSAVDLSAIPLSAVERIDVLTDGASAVYGADAVAGVVNIILQKKYNGIETVARLGDSTQGGGGDRQISQLLGHSWNTGSVILSYENYRQHILSANQRSFSNSTLEPFTLIPSQNKNSLYGSIRQDIGSLVSSHLETIYTRRTDDSVVSQLAGGVYRVYSSGAVQQSEVSGGIDVGLATTWLLSIDALTSSNKTHYVSQFYTPTATVPSTTAAPINTRLESIGFDTEGPMFELPAGDSRLAFGAGHRQERLDTTLLANVSAIRKIEYVYGELRIPVAGGPTRQWKMDTLDISLSGRYENFNDFGRSIVPKVGIVYAPYSGLTLSSTWGRSFRAPTLNELYAPTSGFVYSGSGFGSYPNAERAILVSGGNRNLEPERSKSWTLSAMLKPTMIPGLAFRASYFDIAYSDRIATPLYQGVFNIIGDPVFKPYVSLNPTAQQQNSVVESLSTLYNFTGPYLPEQVLAIFDNRSQNVREQTTTGLDLSVIYRVPSARGIVNLGAAGTWMRISQRLTPATQPVTITAVVFNPPGIKLRGSAGWDYSGMGVSVFVNYIGSEMDNPSGASVPMGRRVASWTTVDTTMSYEFDTRRQFLKGLRLQFAMMNALNRWPPTVAASTTSFPGIGYDATNTSPIGRFISVTATKKW